MRYKGKIERLNHIISQENRLEKITILISKFKEMTREDEKLLKIFKDDNRFSDISFAGVYLAGIALRNKAREAGNLAGEMEKSPYSEAQEKLINEYSELKKEFEEIEEENNDVIELLDDELL